MRVILAMIREGSNITQMQISRCAGISQGYYSDIEGGLRCPSPEVAVRIAHVLGIPESDIFRVFYAGTQKMCARGRKDAG